MARNLGREAGLNVNRGGSAVPVYDVSLASGTDLVALDKVMQTYQYKPGWGGRLQRQNQAGYHSLSHGGAITGIALADYIIPPTTATQAGGRARLSQVYSTDYQSK
jgi:hypothetical protein